MRKTDRHLPLSIAIAVLVHVGAIGLLAVGFQFSQRIVPVPSVVINTVKAKVVDASELERIEQRRLKALQQEELKRKQRLQEEKRLAEQKAKKEKERQAALKAEQARKQAALEKKKRAEEARKAAKLKKAAEAKRRAEKKKAEEARRRAAEKKRKQEERAIEQQRLARLEEEEAEIRAAEQEARRLQQSRRARHLIAQYQDAIRSKIERNWRRPLDYQSTAWCRVFVRQDSAGSIQNVVVEECIGSEAFRKSVEKAVWKSAPLPLPPSPELFHQELRFTFDPRAS